VQPRQLAGLLDAAANDGVRGSALQRQQQPLRQQHQQQPEGSQLTAGKGQGAASEGDLEDELRILVYGPGNGLPQEAVKQRGEFCALLCRWVKVMFGSS